MAKPQWLIENIGPVQAPSWTLDEAAGKTGKLIARGIFGECDAVNGNGRIYPKKLIEAQIERLGERLKGNQVVGHLDHPADGKTSLMLVSHYITKLWLDGNKIMGEAVVLNTDPGKQLRALLEGGVVVGLSSRGRGSTKRTDEGEVVQEDFQLDTFDFVADPSVKIALPKIYQESLDHVEATDPVQMFQQEFPEAYAALTEAVQRDASEHAKAVTAKAIETAIEAERTRVRTEMTEAFERQLVTAMVTLREDLEREIREEFAQDPEVGGAKAALAQVVEMVMAYKQQPNPDALRDALRARELELTAAQGERAEAERLRDITQRLLHLEQRISGHPLCEQLRTLLTPVVTLGQVVDVDQAIAGLLKESKDMVPVGQVEALAQERVALHEAQRAIEQERGKVSQLEDRLEKMQKNLKRAVEISESLDAQVLSAKEEADAATKQAARLEEQAEELRIEAYKYKSLVGVKNAKSLMRLMENVTDRDAVDELIAEGRAQAMADGNLEEARRAFRGNRPGAEVFRRLEEERPQRADADESKQLAASFEKALGIV